MIIAATDSASAHHGRRARASRWRAAARKSNGVPATLRRSPVGIRVASTGVYRSAGSRQPMIQYAAVAVLAGEIEIAVIGDVDDRRPIRGRSILDRQFVVVAQRVGRGDLQRSGIAAFAIGAYVPEARHSPGRRSRPLDLPQHLVESLKPAVQMIRPVVGLERVPLPVELELPPRDAVREAPHRRAEILRLGEILGCARVTEHDIGRLPVRSGTLRDWIVAPSDRRRTDTPASLDKSTASTAVPSAVRPKSARTASAAPAIDPRPASTTSDTDRASTSRSAMDFSPPQTGIRTI